MWIMRGLPERLMTSRDQNMVYPIIPGSTTTTADLQ